MAHRRGALVKNAVDVKMAVDAVSLMSSLPHIDVYVIVSGDRDFIHVLESMQEAGEPSALAFGDLVKYARTLYLGGALAVKEDRDEVFFRDRSMSLALDPLSVESLVLAYETAVATRIVAVAGETPVDAATVCAVLGLDAASPDDLTYSGGVLDAAKRRAAANAAQRSA